MRSDTCRRRLTDNCLGLALFCLSALTWAGSPPPPPPPLPHVSSKPVALPVPKGTNPVPKEAIRAILSAFGHYEVVGMSAGHADKDMDDFIFDLIRDPDFSKTVNDIVVECGNSLYQPMLDRYIRGGKVPLSDARKVWRNTTQPMCGVSGFYDQLFPLVRRINATLPSSRKIRILAGDPPIDWSRINNHADLMRQDFSRDASIAQVMEREVFGKHRKALMLFGIAHLLHGVGDSAVGMYEKKYPGKTLVIAKHDGFGLGTPYAKYNRRFEKRMASWPIPSLVVLKDTWLDSLLEKLPSQTFTFSTRKGPNGKNVTTYVPDNADKVTAKTVDAYLYLGPARMQLSAPIPAYIYLDTKYVHELRRRAAIVDSPVYDQDLPSHIFETDSSRFLHETSPSTPH